MKFTIKKQILADALKNINNVVDHNSGNVQLSAVHIFTKDNNLYLTATKGSASYQQIISDVKIEKEGDILIKAKFFYNIISKLINEEITINQIDETILQIKTPTYSCEINLLDNYSYPSLNFDHEGWDKITLEYDTIVNISSRVKPFVCMTDVYTVAQGIYFNAIDEKNMECVASDHFRIAYYKFEYTGTPMSFIADPEVIKFAYEILSSTKNKTIDLYVNGKICMLQVNDTTVSFALFENQYPNIISRINEKQKYSFTVKLSDLYNALTRGAVFVANEQRPIANLNVSNGKLNIKFISAESGNSFEQIEIMNSNIENFEAKINQKLFTDMISTIKSETITFNFNGPLTPIIITSENPYFINLIMVMQSI